MASYTITKGSLKITRNTQSGGDRDLIATWTLPADIVDTTDKCRYEWYYISNGVNVQLANSTVDPPTNKNQKEWVLTYSVPGNYTTVYLKIAPQAKTHKVGNNDVSYYTGTWCTGVKYTFNTTSPRDAGAIKDANIKFSLVEGSPRRVRVSWTWDGDNRNQLGYSTTAEYQVKWYWSAKDVRPNYPNETNTGILILQDEADVPSGMKYVWASILPVAVNPDSWVAKWSTSKRYDGLAGKTEELSIKPYPPKMYVPGGEERVIRIEWTWQHEHTDHINLWRQYAKVKNTDGSYVWVNVNSNGDPDKCTGNKWNSEWSIDEDIIAIRSRIRAISEINPNTETYYWTAESSDWSTDDETFAPPDPVKPAHYKAAVVTGIVIIAGTVRTIKATWKWDVPVTAKNNIDHYNVWWEYAISKNGGWIDKNDQGSPDQVKGNASESDRWNVPDNAVKIRVQIQPVSKTDSETGNEYWTADRSDITAKAANRDFSPDADNEVEGITDVNWYFESGADRTIIATWEWDRGNTDHFVVTWKYDDGHGTWLAGTQTEVAYEDDWQASYAVPSNATKVLLQILPVAEQVNDLNGNMVDAWKATIYEEEISLSPGDVENEGTVTDVRIDIQSGSQRTLVGTWSWSQSHTDYFDVKWLYATDNSGRWYEGQSEQVDGDERQALYDAPETATKVKLRIKPVSEMTVDTGVEVAYWDAEWSDTTYTFNLIPETPPVPTVSIKNFILTASVSVYDVNSEIIEFEVVRNNLTVFATGESRLVTNYAAFSCNVNVGDEYKVRCRAVKGDQISEWSEYSDNYGTIPATPLSITSCKALSETSVELHWTAVTNAESYEIQYATDKSLFDVSDSVQSTTVEAIVTMAIIEGLDAGEEWFFRVRAVNSAGNSGWTDLASTVLGKEPVAPTTWSLSTTVRVGEDAVLYWVHNCEDGCSQTAAEIELTINGQVDTVTITDGFEDDEISSYILPTAEYEEGAIILWRIRTKGIQDNYGEWSVQREIKVYAPPTLDFGIGYKWNWFWDPFNFRTDNIYDALGYLGDSVSVITHFPFYISAIAGPATQKPIGFYVTISSLDSYETVDQIGQKKWVTNGEQLYEHYFEPDKYRGGTEVFNGFHTMIHAGDVDLENNMHYIITCVVSMDSGLTAEASREFTVAWDFLMPEPNMEFMMDMTTWSAHIKPYCRDEEGNLLEDVLLSVYRRNYDGTFIQVAKDLDNDGITFVTDPHPALDYARYRLIAMSRITGVISYYDPPGYPVQEKSVIIQWDEVWSNFDVYGETYMERAWAGSLLRLPYNIDVSDSYGSDAALVKYIGRSFPVSYYGTQLDQTATWNVEIDKEDLETIYALRRLAAWMGNAYVREPSGSGYWARVTVSFSRKHLEPVMPVTLSITRVDGGV